MTPPEYAMSRAVSSDAFITTAIVAITAGVAIALARRYIGHILKVWRYRTKVDADGAPYFVGVPLLGCLDWATRRNQYVRECLSMIPGNILRLRTTDNVSIVPWVASIPMYA
jgi:hypothetical protein